MILVADPEVLVVDTRNDYEIEVGTFKGAINPNTETFTQFPDYVKNNMDPAKHKKKKKKKKKKKSRCFVLAVFGVKNLLRI